MIALIGSTYRYVNSTLSLYTFVSVLGLASIQVSKGLNARLGAQLKAVLIFLRLDLVPNIWV